MKIFLVNDKFSPEITGVGGYMKTLADKFLIRGHDVYIITATLEKNQEGFKEEDGIKIYRVYTKVSHYLRNYLQIYNPRISKKIKVILKKERPDICHFFNIHERLSYHLLKISSYYSKVTIWHARDVLSFSYNKLTHYVNDLVTLENFRKETYKLNYFDLLKQARKSFNPLKNFLIRYYLSYVDEVLSVSDALREAMIVNNVSQNITVSYSGIDANFFSASEIEINFFKKKYNLVGKQVLLFSGRMSYEKGSWATMDMLKNVTKKRKDIVLFVAAKKDFYSEKLLSYAKQFNISENIIISGWLDRQEMKKAYLAADVVLSPSVCLDAFPKINLEAMAAKKPIVGTCFGGTPEAVVNGLTGFIVNPLDTEKFSLKVLDLIENENKANKFGDAGFRRVKEKFNLDIVADNLLKFYSEKLNKKI